MKIIPLFAHNIVRPSSVKSGRNTISELVQQLRNVRNHPEICPQPKKPDYVEIDFSRLVNEKADNPNIEATAEYKKLLTDTINEAKQSFIQATRQATWKNAYMIEKSYSANGGAFSYAQQIANKSGKNVIGIIGEYTSQTKQKRIQQVLFKPQGKIQSMLSNFGNFIFSRKWVSSWSGELPSAIKKAVKSFDSTAFFNLKGMGYFRLTNKKILTPKNKTLGSAAASTGGME
nr:hypothetical protein [Providencia alcalifaciens]